MIVALLWIAAFFFSLPVVQPYELARFLAYACMGGAFVFAVAGVLRRDGAIFVPRNALVLAGGAFLVLAAVSVAAGAVPYVGILALATLCLMPLSAGALLWGGARALRVASIGAGVILAGLALWALAQFFLLPDMLVGGRVWAPFANPNAYAALLAAGVFPALAAGRKRAVYLALAALLMMGVAVTGGRAVAWLLLAAGPVYAWLQGPDKRGRWQTAGVFAAGVAAVFLLPLLGGAINDGQGDVLTRSLAGAQSEAGWFGRTHLWAGVLAMIADAPFIGRGLGTFFLYYPEYRLAGDLASAGVMAHSDPLQFAAEMGVAAPVLFYVFMAAALWRSFTADAALRARYAAPLCALGVLAVHAHGDFDFYIPALLVAAGLLLACWAPLAARADDHVMVLRVPDALRGYVLPLIAVPVVCALFVLQGLLMSEWQVKRAQDAALAGDMATFGQLVNAANKNSFGLNARPYHLAATVPLGLLAEAAPEDRPALYAQIVGLLDQAAARNPRMVAVPYARAQAALIYRPDGAPPAEEWLRAALAINPHYLPARMALIDIMRGAGREEEAYALTQAATSQRHYMYPEAIAFYRDVRVQAMARGDIMALWRGMRAADWHENYGGVMP